MQHPLPEGCINLAVFFRKPTPITVPNFTLYVGAADSGVEDDCLVCISDQGNMAWLSICALSGSSLKPENSFHVYNLVLD